MTETTFHELAPIREELTSLRHSGVDALDELSHPEQFNATWLVAWGRDLAVLKHYRHSRPAQIADILKAEQLVSRAGIPVPQVLHQFTDETFVLYEHIRGKHIVPTTGAMIDECADLFVRQLSALNGFTPTWGPPRPVTLPRHALRALSAPSAGPWRARITDDWAELGRLAEDRPVRASHVDWRCDNILFGAGRVTAVLDWESVISLPRAEAVGYAAASLTHSWRPGLHQPLALAAVTRFLKRVQCVSAWAEDSGEARHARLAARYKCAVRLAESPAGPQPSDVEQRELLKILGDV